MYIYSVDTKAFYTDEEMELENNLVAIRARKSKGEEGLTSEIKDRKSALKELLGKGNENRILRDEFLVDTNTVSIFESALTRTLGMKVDELSDALVIVRVYFFEVFHDLCLHGFWHKGEHYVCFTASAGQIRTKKCVFIKESLLKENERKLMCGLTRERINELGGCNTNKYLAYLALCNSSTDVWENFDIDRCIVVDDFETLVRDEVDYIDPYTYEITRRVMDVPVPHTDGCGMILPRLTVGKNTMVRLPFVKGLLAAFPFDQFVVEHGCSPIVKDIYGVEHNIFEERIDIIFTKSQFKMWKYYINWDEYKENFKRYGCEAGICNMEDEYIGNATINYQMLQSLVDFTDDELMEVTAKTRYTLEQLATNRRTMLKVFHATANNPHPFPVQECLMLYPELLQDTYFREELRNKKASLEREAWSGKLDIYAKYLFVVPDLYAFCEWLFLGIENPEGLLQNGEVYTEQFPETELDCLRSPSLYREHPVRMNVRSSEMCAKWFGNKGIYTSTHDLISKVLAFDCDGDKLLVVAEPTIVEVAKRNMKDVVPLYYEMGKAAAQEITNESIYLGMTNAYTGGNIGVISNKISKIWNSEEPDVDSIKRLVMQNNQSIDYAKTLFKTEPPTMIKDRINQAVRGKLPHFFVWAKDKLDEQVEDANSSTVNRIPRFIPKYKFKYTASKFPKFDFHMLMDNPNLIQTNEVMEYGKRYRRLVQDASATLNNNSDSDAYSYALVRFKEDMMEGAFNKKLVVDSIILEIFHLKKSKRKRIFWEAFGTEVLENLKKNLGKQETVVCESCYMRFNPTENGKCPCCGKSYVPIRIGVCVDCGNKFNIYSRSGNQQRCPECQAIYRRKYKAEFIKNKRASVDKQ